MRPSRQLVVIAALGMAGAGGWYAYKEGHLATIPGVGAYFTAPAQRASTPGGARGGAGAPALVEVDTVKTGRIVETREAVGTVRAYESITVTAKVSGVIEKIDFEEGQKVKTGDALVHFDAAERRADIEQAVAETKRATAQRNEVAQRLERAQALRRSGAGTEAQVEDLTAQIQTLTSAIASAEARSRAAEARLEDLVLRAPFAGRIGTRAVSVGAYVSPGTRITSLDDLSRVRLDFSVPENLLASLQPGQVVRAISAAFRDRVFEGKVAVIDTRVDPLTRTVRLTADFDNPDEALRPGMFLSVSLQVTAKDDAVVVPEEAVVSEGLRHIVFVVQNNVVERKVVRIGQRQNGQAEILEGVRPGETIVVRGVQRVRPGATVNPRPIGAPASQPPSANRGAGAQQGSAPTGNGMSLPPVGSAAAAERRG